MDISQIGIAVSLVSVSIAVIKQSWNGKPKCNGDYVKRDDCHRAMDEQGKKIDIIKTDITNHFDTRFEDLKDFIKNGK